MQEIIATGKDVEEAVENACAQLGLTRDDISVEILEMPQKKLFGMSPAKIKVTAADVAFKVADLLAEEPGQKAPPQKDNPSQQPKQQSQQPSQPKHRDSGPPQPQAAEVLPEDIEFESLLVPDEQLRELAEEELAPSAESALAYFRAVAAAMGATDLEYRFYETDRGVKFSIDGENSSLIIGRRGETMDALQYLCMLVSSRTGGDYCKIMIDVAQYRKKREKTLQALALREANKAIKTHYNQTLEPMNPYERRIVHSAVQKIEGVKSESVGTEPNRRVVISLISGGKGNRNRRNDNKGGRSGSSRGRGSDRSRGNSGGNRRSYDDRPKQQPHSGERPATSSSQDNDDGSAVLYGRIDI